MHNKVPNYIRTHRRRWGLTQRELASLLGVKSGTQVSRCERLQRKPTLQSAVAYEVIFGEPVRALFPRVFSEVEEGVMQRASQLNRSLEGSMSKVSKRKRELLGDMLRRATTKPNHHEV